MLTLKPKWGDGGVALISPSSFLSTTIASRCPHDGLAAYSPIKIPQSTVNNYFINGTLREQETERAERDEATETSKL